MSDAAIHAFGTVTKLGSTDDIGTATYSTIPEMKGAPIPGNEHPRIDVSTHDNAAFTREYIAQMGDIPAIPLGDMNWLPNNAVHAELQALNASGAVRIFKTYLNAAVSPPVVITFPAYVANFNPAAPFDNVYSAAVTLQPTAAPTYGSS